MSNAATQFIVSRSGDPKIIPVSAEVIKGIPPEAQGTNQETYKSGGLNFYEPRAKDVHIKERQRYFKFSVSMAYALEHLSSDVCENFNFPPSERHPDGIVQAL